MDLIKETINVMQHIARQYSEGEEIDKYWKAILPEVYGIADNEIFLTLHREYIDEPMKQSAFKSAQTIPPRDIDNLDFAALMLHSEIRQVWLGISEDRIFQSIVDENHGVIYNPTDSTRWVKPSLLWLPHFDAFIGPVHDSLVKRYEEYFFAQHCYNKLVCDGRKNPYVKHTFIQLTDSTDSPALHRLRNKGSEWLRKASRRIATGVGAQPEDGEDARQDWLRRLSPLPLHRQIQKVGATGKAIHDGVIDIQRKGGKYEHVPFDEDLTNPIPDESTVNSNEGIDVEEMLQCLQSCRAEIEKVLGKGKPKLAKRRFKVMEMLAHTSCQKTIARKLNISEPTISRDIQVIEQSRRQIQKILYARRAD